MKKVKRTIFILFKYISIFISIAILLFELNEKGKPDSEDLFGVLVSICFGMLAIYFQGEQKRETDRLE